MTHEERLLLGERLRNGRNEVGYTQEYMADHSGITLRFYQMIERGEKDVSLKTLIRLSELLSISMDYLLFGDSSSFARGDPIADLYASLTPSQRDDATKILKLYAKACERE